MTYIKVNLVAGFLFLPSGFRKGGWLASIFCVVGVSSLVCFCNISLAYCSDVINGFTLAKVGRKALGRPGKVIVETGIAIAQVKFI
jgi:amino acid permease